MKVPAWRGHDSMWQLASEPDGVTVAVALDRRGLVMRAICHASRASLMRRAIEWLATATDTD